MASIVEHYEANFNPKLYAQTYVSDRDYELKTKPEEFYHNIFNNKRIPGDTQLDLASGATFRGVISSSAYINEIYTSDLLISARDEAEKWLQDDPQALDYTWEFKFVAQLEKNNDYKILEERVRKAVKGVLPCNFLLDNPLYPKLTTFDIVTSSYGVDTFPEKKDFFSAVKNTVSLIRPGGYLGLVTTIKTTRYRVGDYDFEVANLSVETTEEAVKAAGLKILESEPFMYTHSDVVWGVHGDGILTILAQKP